MTVVWSFRWEHGPTLNKDNVKIIYTKDRWTQQTWISLYGTEKDKIYSGNTLPVPPTNEVKYKVYQILNSPEKLQEKKNFEDLASEAGKKIEELEWGHAKYLEIVKSLKKRETGFSLIFDNLRYEEYEYAIPQLVIDDHLNWIALKQVITNSTSGIKNLEEQAEFKAKSTLNDRAYLLRSITTIIWAVLLLLSSVSTIIFLKKGFFSKQEGGLKS